MRISRRGAVSPFIVMGFGPRAGDGERLIHMGEEAVIDAAKRALDAYRLHGLHRHRGGDRRHYRGNHGVAVIGYGFGSIHFTVEAGDRVRADRLSQHARGSGVAATVRHFDPGYGRVVGADAVSSVFALLRPRRLWYRMKSTAIGDGAGRCDSPWLS